MAPELKKHNKKVKIKIPKIQRTKAGRKFVKIGKKTVYLDDDVTPNQLLKFILNRIIKKPQKRGKSDKSDIRSGKNSSSNKTVTDSKRTIHIARPTSTVSSGGLDRVAQLIEEQKRDLERKEYEKALKKKLDNEVEAKKGEIIRAGADGAKAKKKVKVPIYDDSGNQINEYEIDEDLAGIYHNYSIQQKKEIDNHKKNLNELHQKEAIEKDKLFKQRKKLEAELAAIKFETIQKDRSNVEKEKQKNEKVA